MKLYFRTCAVALAGLFMLASVASADAPLKSALKLDSDQAAQVKAIQKKTRDAIRPVRGELHREERVGRRAKLAEDSAAFEASERRAEPLRTKIHALQKQEESKIRELLTAEQKAAYAEYLKKRDKMAGSSRDVKEHKKSAQ